MGDQTYYLIRCDNCFVVRIEEEERLCPICNKGTLRITDTRFEVNSLERAEVQELLKKLMVSKVNEKQLAAELRGAIDSESLQRNVKEKLVSYLFYGNHVARELDSEFADEIRSIVIDCISKPGEAIGKISGAVNFKDTESVIAFIKLKSSLRDSKEYLQEASNLLWDKFNLKSTNTLVCCDNCSTLYRSLGLTRCIFCNGKKLRDIWDSAIEERYKSQTQIMICLILAAQGSDFVQFKKNILAYIATYPGEFSNSDIKYLRTNIEKVNWNQCSLLQLNLEISRILSGALREQERAFRLRPESGNAGAILSHEYHDAKVRARASTTIEKEYDPSFTASVFSPVSAAVKETFMIQVFLHEAGLAKEVKVRAISADSKATLRFEASPYIDTNENQEFEILLISKDLEVDESKYTVNWQGGIASVQFLATIPATLDKSNIFCTILIAVKSVPIGHLKFRVDLISDSKKPEKDNTLYAAGLKKFNKIFISYASEDRTEVFKRVQILKTLKIDFFQDVLSLEPGDRWEQMLYEKISVSDAFFLFWSSAASRSDWVKKEIIYALSINKGKEETPPYIVPVIIEGPPPPPPPKELAFLQFNDQFLYFIN